MVYKDKKLHTHTMTWMYSFVTILGIATMRCTLVKYLLLIAFLTHSPFALSFDHSHAPFSAVLKDYLNSQGMVNYKKLKEDTKKDSGHIFNKYLADLQKVSFAEYEKWDKNKKMAFLINAYNAFTLKLIIKHYPVKSIKKIGGVLTKPWDVEFFSLLDGKLKTLDPIEHEWLRPIFKDYRIHAAVNCASISCPPLRHEAFVAEKLDAQMDEQMTTWLTDPTRNKIKTDAKSIELSKIFDWYKDDFVEWGGGIPKVLAKYLKTGATEQALSKKKIKYMNYSWDLNEYR